MNFVVYMEVNSEDPQQTHGGPAVHLFGECL